MLLQVIQVFTIFAPAREQRFGMRKSLFIFLMMLSMISVAQDFERHYIQFNIGDNILNSIFSGTYSPYYPYYPCLPCEDNYGYDPYAWFEGYTGTYNSYQAIIPITFSLQYFYAIKPWLHVGADVYYSGDYYHTSERGTGRLLHRDCNIQLSVLPSIRFQFFNRQKVGMYAGLAAGFYYNYLKLNSTAEHVYFFAWQTTFFGLRVGNRVFWTLELGAGNKGFVTTGVGVRI